MTCPHARLALAEPGPYRVGQEVADVCLVCGEVDVAIYDPCDYGWKLTHDGTLVARELEPEL